jgi:glycosyltransferase involved in cell wall biosynthesis
MNVPSLSETATDAAGLHPAAEGEIRAGAFGLTVLQVLPRLETGGVERGTVDIAAAIVRAGGKAIVASAGGPMVRELERAGARHVVLPLDTKNPLKIRRNIEPLAALIREHGVDIVHGRSRAPTWSARAAALRAGVPFVTTFHGTYNFGNFLKRRYNAVMTKGDAVIAISNFIADHIRRHYRVRDDRIAVIHRGIDLEIFNPRAVPVVRVQALAQQWRLPDGWPVVMLPGRLTRWKGQTVFLDALALLKEREFMGVIVGSEQSRQSYRTELEALIARLGLEMRVRLVDETRDMPAALMLADVVVSASTDPEAFGRIVVEAAAMGRPVIASDHGAARETVLPDRSGWLVPPGNAPVLAEAIEKALALAPAERRSMAYVAEAHAKRHFSKTMMCDKTLDLYRRVAALHRAR